MFDIGFWELLLIAVIALVVVGPERLPGLARTIGFWIGKARRMVASVREEIDQELNKAEQLETLVKKELEIQELHETIDLDKPNIAASTRPKYTADEDTSKLEDHSDVEKEKETDTDK